MKLAKSDYYIQLPDTESKIYLKRFGGTGDIIFMVHGAVESGRVFYSDNDKGLAPFLARKGFDVFVMDLRGRGKSERLIDAESAHGQTESIRDEIPAAINYIQSLEPTKLQHWIGHSWGGVLLVSVLARYPALSQNVLSQIYFGSKRFIGIKSWRKYLYINIIWYGLCGALVKAYGYLPAKQYRFGADNETNKSHRQCIDWIRGPWLDGDDGFDYGNALKSQALPPTWFIAAVNDHVLGNPADVQRFLSECGLGQKRYALLAKQSGNLLNYNHINMLTHPQAEIDHFPTVYQWIKSKSLNN